MDRFVELESFVRVVDAGTITAAAERLGVAKSVVSRRLRELETRLGAQLLQRTTRTMSLTDSGRSLYERAVRLLDDLDEAELTVSERHGELAGRLRVAAPLTFGMRHLAPAIEDFACRHREVSFDLDFNDRLVDLVEEGFDLGIRIARLEDSSLIARRLAETELVVCASPAYLEAHGRPRAPEELTAHRCLVYSNASSPEIWGYESSEGDRAEVHVPIHLRANNGDFLTEMAIAGLGVVLEPDFIVYDAIERGELVPLLTDHRWPTVAVHAIYPPTRFLSRRVRELIDFLAERFEGTPRWQRWREP